MDVVPAGERDREAGVVMATLSSFIEHEQQESHSIVDRLVAELRSQDLAVAGSAAALDALRWGEVDNLVMANGYDPDPGWLCTACRALGIEVPETRLCPQCGKSAVRSLNVREALLRLAGQQECTVEVVKQSDALMSLGGVGRLLRYGPDIRHGNPDEQEAREGITRRHPAGGGQ